MNINFMTWNTQLYEYGNKSFKRKNIDDGKKILSEQIEIVLSYLEKENSIVVLQEIPYKSNITWKEHELFVEFKNNFPENQYSLIYNVNNNYQIKMTVVISKKEFIKPNIEGVNNNCCVSFTINGTDLNVLGVHSHNAFELRELLFTKELVRPNIMLGDFNSGNYLKQNEDNKIVVNRQNYLLLTEGYIDICQGEYTHHIYKTHIDHILLENSNEFLEKHKYNNVIVDRKITLSDHYPIYCEIMI
jgi:exonuclease III